jgi:Arc/MetJ-type ribon-helix-helix transcriptional regulator
MTVNLSPEAMALIQRLIETRGYRDAEAVVEEALRFLDELEPEHEAELQAALDDARASGSVAVDPDRLEAELIAGIRRSG